MIHSGVQKISKLDKEETARKIIASQNSSIIPLKIEVLNMYIRRILNRCIQSFGFVTGIGDFY